MKQEELISIIIPVYNTNKYLKQCLESVCEQTYKNLEIIIVNDGSTDDSLNIIMNYAKNDARIIVINQENRGVSESRNSGLKKATGEFILFLDSDDWIDKECCEYALKTLQTYDADVVFWSYLREYPRMSKSTFLFDKELIVWDDGSIKNLYRKMIGLTKEELEYPQKIDSLITVWGKLYSREIIADHTFVDMKLIGSEDTLFNIQVFKNVKKAVYLPELWSHYRKENSSSLTHCYKKELVHRWNELYRRIKFIMEEQNSGDCYDHALSNRIALGLIGLGLNIVEDNKMSFLEKRRELCSILSQQQYKDALKSLEKKYLPLKWKVFFLLAKNNNCFLLCVLLYIMNFLRGN